MELVLAGRGLERRADASDERCRGRRDHSETNVQVAGVDEGDIVEFDSDYVYMLTGQDLVILDAWPATDLAEVSRTEVEGTPIAQFLKGDRLTVISRTDPYYPWYDVGPWVRGPMLDIAPGPWRPYPWPNDVQSTTIVTVFNVTDRSAPTIVQKTTLEGSYIESRAVGDFVYLVLSNQAVAPAPLVKQDPSPQDPVKGGYTGPGTYETKEEYLARFRAMRLSSFRRRCRIIGATGLTANWPERLAARTGRHLPTSDRGGDEPDLVGFSQCDEQRTWLGRIFGRLHQRQRPRSTPRSITSTCLRTPTARKTARKRES